MTGPAAPVVGVIMLDTRFPRPAGDIGNAASWPVEVAYETVPAATVARATRAGGPDPDLLPAFEAAAAALARRGVRAVATSCGFLAPFQERLQAAAPVPVFTSALLAIPGLIARGERVGVLTFDARTLGPAHLSAAGAPPDLPVEGLDPSGPLHRAIAEDRDSLDASAAAWDTVEAARRLCARAPDLTTILYECTNLPPYDREVRGATGRRSHDLVGLVVNTLSTI